MSDDARLVAADSNDVASGAIDWVKERFPGAIVNGAIDFDTLRLLLGDSTATETDRYTFRWVGKEAAIRQFQRPSSARLEPIPDQSIRWDDTGHVFIEGENLEVLKLLYKSYANAIKLIYIDPPYNTGNDFIYSDKFSDPLDGYLKQTGQRDLNGDATTSNLERNGRRHSRWLSMLYPRLLLARHLLRDDGVIFVSIDDNEVHHLRLLMNDVFGEENFIATVIWQKVYAPKNTARHFSEDHDYILVYARNGATWRPGLLPRSDEADARYSNPDDDPRGDWKPDNMLARNYYSRGIYTVVSPSGKTFANPTGTYWRTAEDKFDALVKDNRVWWGETGSNMPALKRFLSEVRQGVVPQTLWSYRAVGHTQEAKKELLSLVRFTETENVLNSVKPSRLLQRMVQLATTAHDGDLILDFFSGSAPMAQAVMNQNRVDGGDRRFLLVQLPEPLPKAEAGLATIADIGQRRIRAVIERLQARPTESLAPPEPDDDERLAENGGQAVLSLATAAEKPADALVSDDLGVRVFRLAEPLIRRDVEDEAQEALFVDPLVPGWTVEGVLWEVALREGFSLSSRLAAVPAVTTNTVVALTDTDKGQTLYLCLDEAIDPRTLPALAAVIGERDLFVCRDIALTDDLAANLALQFSRPNQFKTI